MFLPLKTKLSRRGVALGDKTIQFLRDYFSWQWSSRFRVGDKRIDHGLMFTNSKGGPLTASYVTQVLKKFLVSAGIQPVNFHSFGHTHASLLIRHGVPSTTVAKRLGHSKTSTTRDVYSHLMDSQQTKAVELMDELIIPIKLHTT